MNSVKKCNIQTKFNSIKIQNLFVVGLIEIDYSFIVIKKILWKFTYASLSLAFWETPQYTHMFLLTGFSLSLRYSNGLPDLFS